MGYKHRLTIGGMVMVAAICFPSLVCGQMMGLGNARRTQNRRPAAKAAAGSKTTPANSIATSDAGESLSTAAAPASSPNDRKIDLSYITPEAVAAVIAFPREVLTAPEMEMLPTEVITAAGKKDYGIDPLQINEIVAIAEPGQAMLPTWGVVLQMAAPLAQGKVLGPLWDQTTDGQLDGKPYRKGTGPMAMSIFSPDGHTLLVASDPLLKKMLSNHAAPKDGRMAKVLARVSEPPDVTAILLVEPVRPLLAIPLAMFPLPPPYEDAKKLPDLLTSVGLKASLIGNTSMTLSLKANDEAAAQQAEEIIDKLLAGAQQQMTAQTAAQPPAADDPVAQASAQYSKRMTERMLKALHPVRTGHTLTVSNSGNANSLMTSMVGMAMFSSLSARSRSPFQNVEGMGGVPGLGGVPRMGAAPGIGAPSPGGPPGVGAAGPKVPPKISFTFGRARRKPPPQQPPATPPASAKP